MSLTPESFNIALDKYTSGPDPRLPGTVAVAVSSHGKTLFSHSAGNVSPDSNESVTVDTVFWYGSLAKVMTTIAALQCIEQGLTTLDAPVGDLVPELGNAEVLEGFDEDGKPILKKPQTQITLRMLLNHTSGCGYAVTNPLLQKYQAYNNEARNFLSGDIKDYIQPLLFQPGTSWSYGPGTDWVGVFISRLANMSLEAFMRKHIFEPLSISSMTFHPAELKAFAPTSYRSTTSTPSITSGEHPVYAFPTPSELGGFGLYGNSTDFAKVLSAILTSLQDSSSSELKVSSALVSEIFASQLGPKPTEAFQGLRSAAPPAVFAAGSLPTDAPLGYGFSVTVNTSDIPGMRRSGSGGWWGYPNTYYWLDPKSNVAGVVLMQLLPACDAQATEYHKEFELGVYRLLQGI